MLDLKRAHRLRFVGRQIVNNHVNLLPERLVRHDLAEEFDKRGAGVARYRLPQDFPERVSSAANSDSVPCR